MKDTNVFPFYASDKDQYDSHYKHVMFVPGKAVQARELTESQLLLARQNWSNWDTLYKNGSVTDGCSLTVTLDPYGQDTVTVPIGKFYYQGRILEVEEQIINIDGSGDENVGFFVEETFINYSEDSTLVDSANGYTNYGLDGAQRLKIEVKLVKIIDAIDNEITLPSNQKYSDADGVTLLWNLTDGVVQNYLRTPDYTLLSKVLAKRTYETSGNYLVEGMKLKIGPSTVPDKIKVIVEPGICYVKGYDNTFITQKVLQVDKSLTTQDFSLEPHTYHSGTSNYQLIHPFVVTNTSVKPITIIAEVVDDNVIMTRGVGDSDVLTDIYLTTYNSVTSVISVTGSGTYVRDVDYELIGDLDGYSIHWISGNRPSTASEYTVSLTYLKNLIRDTDFTVEVDPYEVTDVYNIIISNSIELVDSSEMIVDYSIYKARTDLYSIDKFGNIIATIGVPTSYDQTIIPPFSDEMLPLGWIKFMPGLDYDETLLYEYKFVRTTMFDLHYMRKRVDDLETNVAALALEGEAKEGELPTTLKGIFADPFNTLYKADLIADDYYAATNLIDGELYMVSLQKEVVLDRTSDIRTNIDEYTDTEDNPKLLTLKKNSESVFFSQLLKTDTMNCNPWGYIKMAPSATIHPSGDEWVDTVVQEATIVNNQTRKSTTAIHQLQWVSNPTNDTQFIKQTRRDVGSKVSYSQMQIGENLITYARQGWVYLSGKNFEPAGIITATFGGIIVTLVPIAPYIGTSPNVTVAADGSFQAKFYIPSGVTNGNIELKMVDEYNNQCVAIYKSKGIQKIIQNRTTITKITDLNTDIFDIVKPPVTPDIIPIPVPPTPPVVPVIEDPVIPRRPEKPVTNDPVAESFIFDSDKVLTSIGFYFGTKATTHTPPSTAADYYNYSGFQPTQPVILTIGLVVNGTPDSKNLIHSQNIYPSEITTSLYGTVESKITLKKPIYIPAMTEFYISIGSKSTEYSVFYAKLGQKDIRTMSVVTAQPYQDGVMFTSSNGITWTANQDSDLTIQLYSGVFSTTGSFIMENISFPDGGWTGFGRFMYLNDLNILPNTNALFYYSLNGGTTWTQFTPSSEVNTALASTNLKLKCELSGNGTATPIINVKNTLLFFKYDLSKDNIYRTKQVNPVPAYNNIKIIVDEYLPTGTSLTKEFAGDIYNYQWFRIVSDPIESVSIGSGFYRNTYIFDFKLLQRLTVSSISGFAVGNIVNSKAKIVSIDTINKYIWILLDDSGKTPYAPSDSLNNGTVTQTISAALDYENESEWFLMMTGKILLESTSYWKSPVCKNYRIVATAQ